MTGSQTPLWLLDVDGVVIGVSGSPDRTVWPADQWIRAVYSGDGVDALPILVARPVLDLIRQAHDSGRVEIEWHTSWQRHAPRLGTLLGLPDLPVHPCPEWSPGADLDHRGPWWKLAAVERVIGAGRPLLWTDDDAESELQRARMRGVDVMGRVTARTLVVSPPSHTGLTRRGVRRVREFLDLPPIV